MPVNGGAVTVAAVGGLLLYSGIKGTGVLAGVQNIVQGKSPTSLPSVNTIAGTPATAATGGAALTQGILSGAPGVSGNTDAHTALLAAAASHGWSSGAQWSALDSIEMEEAGYDPTAKNPSSGAWGLAQSLGHGFPGGPAPNGVNEYGGEGLSAAESYAASMGDPVPQAKWMCNYIASRYGTPVVAQQFHLANGWY